jgi:quercetin dioxygenase-like cupin family protein
MLLTTAGKMIGAFHWLCLTILLASVLACARTQELPDPLAAGWQGEAVCQRLHEDRTQRILRCTFEPGVGHERHRHAPHFGYALSGGRMRITDDGGTRDVDLATGSSYSSSGVVWHEVLNIGETTTIYLIIEPK